MNEDLSKHLSQTDVMATLDKLVDEKPPRKRVLWNYDSLELNHLAHLNGDVIFGADINLLDVVSEHHKFMQESSTYSKVFNFPFRYLSLIVAYTIRMGPRGRRKTEVKEAEDTYHTFNIEWTVDNRPNPLLLVDTKSILVAEVLQDKYRFDAVITGFPGNFPFVSNSTGGYDPTGENGGGIDPSYFSPIVGKVVDGMDFSRLIEELREEAREDTKAKLTFIKKSTERGTPVVVRINYKSHDAFRKVLDDIEVSASIVDTFNPRYLGKELEQALAD